MKLTITDGPRWNLSGPEIREASPAAIAHWMRRWVPDAELRRFPDRLVFWGSSGALAPDLTARGQADEIAGLIEWDDEGDEPIPSVPDDGLWPADQPTTWSAEPDTEA